MTGLFTSILNISITAGYAAIAVIIIRLFLKKLPKIFSYVLWLAVFIRLVFPFSFKSDISFLNFIDPKVQTLSGTIEYVPHNIGLMQKPEVFTGISSINNAVSSNLPSAVQTASVNPMQIILLVAAFIWAAGTAAMLIYSIISYIKLKNKVKTATLVKENIYETDRISSPFLCGFIRPKIYVPVGIDPDELSYILLHEKTHIKRFDYIIKPFAYLLLIIHWFNPVMWISFALMSKDMEMSCDENVIKEMGSSIKGYYSTSLLSMSMKRSGLAMGSPLCFGESNIKSRIKNILNYKKPAFWVVIIIAAATGILIFSLVSNPNGKNSASTTYSSYSGYMVKTLMDYKTPYVGNNSKVAALIDAMPIPDGIKRDSIELQTKKQPYGITINYIKDNHGLSLDYSTVYNSLYRNSIMLFSLVDNVDNINCKVTNEMQNVASYSFSRTEVEKLIGGDVRLYAENTNKLKSLIGNISKRSFVNPSDDTAKKIDSLLDVITSSPLESSNPYDYIKAHKVEYESILKMGDYALDYLDALLKKEGNNSLKGYIILALRSDISKGKKNITDYNTSYLYSGRALSIGVIGEVPTVWEKQVKFYKIQFSDLENHTFDTKYDAIFISKENLLQASQNKYKSIYRSSKIPFFFFQSKKGCEPFIQEDLTYDKASDDTLFFANGIIYVDNKPKLWATDLCDNIENETTVRNLYSRIFEAISDNLATK